MQERKGDTTLKSRNLKFVEVEHIALKLVHSTKTLHVHSEVADTSCDARSNALS